MTEQVSLLYELRLLIVQGEKKTYTTDELAELLDKIAMTKNQE